MSEQPTPPAQTLSALDARRAARNVGALVVASVLSKALLFGWQIVLSTWLGPTDFGIFNTVMALFAIGTSIANFGIGMIAIRDIASHPKRIGQYAAAMLFSHTILSGLAYVGVVLASVAAGYSPTIIAFMAIAGLSLIIDIFGSIGNDLLLAQERMVLASGVDVAQVVLRVALAGFALWAGWGLLGVYVATLVSGVVRSIVLLSVHYRDGLRPEWPLKRDIVRSLLFNAAPLALTAFLSLAYQHADKLMTTSIIGVRNTGFLGPAFLINFGMIELLSTTILVAMYPLMSRYHDDNLTETFGYIVETLARFMLMVALPLALLLSIFAQDVILLIFSPDYAPTIGILQILIWYTLLTMVGNVFAKALLIQNRQRVILLIRVFTLALNIGLNAFLLLRYRDPRGAAVASVLAEALALALMAWRFRAAGFHWGRILPGSLRVLMIGGAAGLTMLGLGQVHVLAGMLGGGLIYAAGIVAARVLSSEDWDLMYRLVAAMPGGTFIRRYWQRDIVVNW